MHIFMLIKGVRNAIIPSNRKYVNENMYFGGSTMDKLKRYLPYILLAAVVIFEYIFAYNNQIQNYVIR